MRGLAPKRGESEDADDGGRTDVGTQPALLGLPWVFAGNAMTAPRLNHTATLLDAHNPERVARVLLVGGRTDQGDRTATVDIYDPLTNTISATGSMNCAREMHTSTRLDDGRVLVVGGLSSGDGLPPGGDDVACPTSEGFSFRRHAVEHVPGDDPRHRPEHLRSDLL